MEKLTIRDGPHISVYEISDKLPWRFWPRGRPPNIFDCPLGCYGVVKWSPRGTYFVYTRSSFIVICKPDGGFNPMISCFHPLGRYHVDFSPSEKYLATCSMRLGEVNLRIHDVGFGTLLKEFKGSDCAFLGGQRFKSSCDDVLPLIRWSVDDEYASLIEKNSLSIYACEALFSRSLTSISNVIDFRWSPTDPLLALLQSNGSDGEVLVSIIKFPEETDVVDTKKLKSVSNMRICWHEEGKYVAFTYKTLGEDSGILIFNIEEHTSTSFVKRNSDVLSFSFEPRGDRFAVIYGGKEDSWLEIMELNMINNFQVLKVQSNAINWSPAGGLLMLSGYDNLLLYDANKRRILLRYHYKTEAAQWSSSGRCVAAYVIDEKKVAIWHSSGELLYLIPILEGNYQFSWCPPVCSFDQSRMDYDLCTGLHLLQSLRGCLVEELYGERMRAIELSGNGRQVEEKTLVQMESDSDSRLHQTR